MKMPPVYLDHNATTPLKPAVLAHMGEWLGATGNPSSIHGFGRAARRAVETAREQVAALVGASPEGVIFTASGSEANNLALRGFPDRRVLASATEHDSVLASADLRLPVDADGRLNLAALRAALAADPRPALVSVMLANNETGVVQPIAEIAAIAHAQGALVHCDAVQAPGRIAANMADLGVDLLTLSSHKLGGPQGAAALVAALGIDPRPLILGGLQERGRRAGTENVAAIAGFGLAAELAAADLAAAGRLAALRDRIEAALPDAVIVGREVARLPNTSCIVMPGVASETQVMALDLEGVAVSAGSACSSGKVRASHVLAAMGFAPQVAGSAVRVSLGWSSEPAHAERFIEVWTALAGRLGHAAQPTRSAA